MPLTSAPILCVFRIFLQQHYSRLIKAGGNSAKACFQTHSRFARRLETGSFMTFNTFILSPLIISFYWTPARKSCKMNSEIGGKASQAFRRTRCYHDEPEIRYPMYSRRRIPCLRGSHPRAELSHLPDRDLRA